MERQRVPREMTQARAEKLVSHEDLQRIVTSWKASPRVAVEVVGRSHEGRDIYSIAISSPENISTLAETRLATKRLTTPIVNHDTLEDVDVHFEGGVPDRPVTAILVEGGGFGMEVAHVEGLIRLVDHLITATDEETKTILKSNVVVVMPMVNPDGRMLAIEEWKRTPLSAGTAGHGNRYGFTLNRDLFNLTQPESCGIAEANRAWGLVAAYDPHEDMALLGVSHPEVCWCPPYNDRPYPAECDPDVMALVDEMGESIASQWKESGFRYLYDPVGKKGLLSFVMGPLAGRVDMWMVQHGVPAILTESARTPGTQLWQDRVDQKFDAAMAVIRKVTREQKRFIGVVRAARSRVPEGKAGAAYVIPDQQTDRGVLGRFLRTLLAHEVVVYHVSAPYPAYVVPVKQPRAGVARTLFSDSGSKDEVLCPDYGLVVYDLASRTQKEQATFKRQSLDLVSDHTETGVRVPGKASPWLSFRNSYSGIVLASRLLKAGCPVARSSAIRSDAGEVRPRPYVIGSDLLPQVTRLAADLDVDLMPADDCGETGLQEIALPRTCVYVGEGIGHLNMEHLADVLWSLDTLEFPFVRVDRESLLSGALDACDVLIVPGGDGKAIIEGLDPEIAWHHAPWEPPVATGMGIGTKGVEIVSQFVQQGGRYLGLGMGGGWFATKDLAGLMDVTTAPAPLGSGIVYLRRGQGGDALLAGYAGVTAREGRAMPDRMAGYFYAPPFYFKEAGTSPLFVAGRKAQSLAMYETSLARESQGEETRRAYVGKGAIVTQRIGKGSATVAGVNIGFRAVWYSTLPFLANVIYG